MKKSVFAFVPAVLAAVALAVAPVLPASASVSASGSASRSAPASAVRPAAADGTVTVQLVTPAKAALRLAKATVEIYSDDFSILRTKKTNSDGRAKFSLPSGTPLTIYTTRAGFVDSVRHIAGVTAGATSTLRVALPRGATVSGTVVNESSTPLRGSTVSVYSPSGTPLVSTVANAKGIYRITGLSTGSYRVQFNSRVSDSPRPGVITNYAWNYWKKSSWASATPISLKQQTATTAATVRKKINSVVPTGKSIKGALSVAGLSGGADVGLEALNYVDTTFGRLNAAGTAFSVKAVKGKYRVYVWGDDAADDIWWYTGETTPPSHDEDDAKVVTFSGAASITLTFAP